ncbi:zinc finger and BTB domain-containing protein 18-like isoform X8 [Ostrea edulis]|uniref:zinc finger and BTB domain-containing protein 18-like isoform X8 n=1 Tax=Ostrea edulis TaxID=37623 RepID=UPI0024AEDF89|nr:zinc finger and BTB domain-containing protein 18-like isoform X8 [Ostrea edulis]
MSYQKMYMNQIYSSSTMSYLTQMWKNQLLCDAVIKTGPINTKAHRLVLIAACPMLQHLENASLGSHLEVRMASDIKQSSVISFLHYLYEGFMTLTEENCRDIEKMGKLLQVESVVKCCSDFYKCFSEKTGVKLGSAPQMNFQDSVEFRHVRTSDFQKLTQDAGLKRSVDSASPSGKRPRIQRADDRASMSHGYNSEPFERGRGSTAADVVEIVEDSLEVVHKEPALRDSEGWPKESDLPPIRTSQSISVASSQMSTNSDDIQIVNVEEADSRTHAASSSPAEIPTHSSGSRHEPSPHRDSQSSSSDRVSFDSTNLRRDQQRYSDISSFGSQLPTGPGHSRSAESFSQSSSKRPQASVPSHSSPQITPPPLSSFTPKMPTLQPKPFAVGSAVQAASIPQPTSIRPAVPIPGTLTAVQPVSNQSPGSNSSQDSRASDRFQNKGASVSSQVLQQQIANTISQNVEKLLAGEGISEQSVKETTSSSDLAPDISFIKVEESDTGGLDMYVDIADDAKGGLLSNQEEGDDDTGEIPFEWTRDESNEGSNLSGDQSGSLPGQEGAFQDTVVRSTSAPKSSSHFCRTTFPTSEGLEHCRETATDQINVSQTRIIVCNICGKSQVSFAHLRRHMISHSTKRNFECSHCGETYKHKSSLKEHIKRSCKRIKWIKMDN